MYSCLASVLIKIKEEWHSYLRAENLMISDGDIICVMRVICDTFNMNTTKV